MQQSVLKISYKKLHNNIDFFKAHTAAKLCVVVKADAYGHGAANSAQSIKKSVDFFAGATVQEGVELRLQGIQKPILVFAPPTTQVEVLQILQYNLLATVTDLQDYFLLAKIAKAEQKVIVAHIKLNTGMNRYGFTADTLSSCVQASHSEFVQIEGIYSHFYCTAQRRRTATQFKKFITLAKQVEGVFGKLCKHIAATGGFFLSSSYHLDMVRLGLGIYGYLPNGEQVQGLAPCMQLYGTVVANQKYTAGGMGYSRHKPQGRALATVRTGYADGLLHQNKAVVPPCMDSQILESNLKKGERILLLQDFQQYATEKNTIVYQVLTAFGNRVQREYFWE